MAEIPRKRRGGDAAKLNKGGPATRPLKNHAERKKAGRFPTSRRAASGAKESDPQGESPERGHLRGTGRMKLAKIRQRLMRLGLTPTQIDRHCERVETARAKRPPRPLPKKRRRPKKSKSGRGGNTPWERMARRAQRASLFK
jgi:hypothetical protein